VLKVIYVVGASCTGKTRLAIEISKSLDGAPIINCDSIQVFSGVEIGTAKPSEEELQAAPHHLFSHVAKGQPYSVANYLNDVLKTLRRLGSQTVIFCGGSGFYIQALQKGLYPEVESTPEVKNQVYEMISEHGFEKMFQWIADKDPEYAAKIHPKDHYRIRRGLEVLCSQNLTITALKSKMELEAKSPLPPHQSRQIGLYWNREEQQDIVHQRSLKMLEAGWIEETKDLLEQGLRDWSPMKSVGYKEVVQYLDGEITRDELPQRITTATLQLIKKQTTWFKKEKEIDWLHAKDWQQALSSQAGMIKIKRR